MCKNCNLLELHQDRIMDKIIERDLKIITIRQTFPISEPYVMRYDSKGRRL